MWHSLKTVFSVNNSSYCSISGRNYLIKTYEIFEVLLCFPVVARLLLVLATSRGLRRAVCSIRDVSVTLSTLTSQLYWISFIKPYIGGSRLISTIHPSVPLFVCQNVTVARASQRFPLPLWRCSAFFIGLICLSNVYSFVSKYTRYVNNDCIFDRFTSFT